MSVIAFSQIRLFFHQEPYENSEVSFSSLWPWSRFFSSFVLLLRRQFQSLKAWLLQTSQIHSPYHTNSSSLFHLLWSSKPTALIMGTHYTHTKGSQSPFTSLLILFSVPSSFLGSRDFPFFLARSTFCLAFLRICSGRVSGSLSLLFWQKPQVFYVMCMYMHIFIYTCMHLYMFSLYLNLLYFLCILQTCIYRYCSCCCSVAQLCSILCDPMDCSTSGFPVLHHLRELAQTLVHWVSDALQPSFSLSSPSPPAFNLSQHQGLFKCFTSDCQRIGASASTSVPLMNIQDWFPSIDWFDLLAVQGTLKSLQHHSWEASILWHSTFFMVQLSHPYMTTAKTIALTRWNFLGKVMSLLFNTLSRFVITLLPRSKRLLILWLQSPSAVILEPQKIKSFIVSIVSPSICHEVMGPEAIIFFFECWVLRQCFHLSPSSRGSLVPLCFLT